MTADKILRWLKRHKNVPVAIIATGICIILVLMAVTSWMAIPKARKIHEYSARSQTSSRIYVTVKSVIEELAINTDLCTETVYTDSGSISYVSVDSAKINEICNTVVHRLNESFKEDPYIEIRIPFGDAVGMPLLTGKGPSISVRASVYPTFYADVSSRFKEAGINQTLHELTLTVVCSSVSVCGDDRAEINESYTFSLQQRLIVGGVPFT